jgi:hypothetical protein
MEKPSYSAPKIFDLFQFKDQGFKKFEVKSSEQELIRILRQLTVLINLVQCKIHQLTTLNAEILVNLMKGCNSREYVTPIGNSVCFGSSSR